MAQHKKTIKLIWTFLNKEHLESCDLPARLYTKKLAFFWLGSSHPQALHDKDLRLPATPYVVVDGALKGTSPTFPRE